MNIPDSVITKIKRAAFSMSMREFNDAIPDQPPQTPEEIAYTQRTTVFHGASGTIVGLTRSHGLVAGGLVKSPCLDRRLHLSLSFRFPQNWGADRVDSPQALAKAGNVIPLAVFNWTKARLWCERIFEMPAEKLVVERAKTKTAQTLQVHHFFCFMDAEWKPIPQLTGDDLFRDFEFNRWRWWSEIR